jgi:hypothetical protein
MIITEQSHLDHGLTGDQIAYILEQTSDKDAFFIESFELPESLGTVPSGLYGPAAGDEPIPEVAVIYKRRGDRKGESRMIAAPARQQSWVTVIGGPDDSGALILYTAYGGPLAPREPFDVLDEPAEVREESETFWAEHALSTFE